MSAPEGRVAIVTLTRALAEELGLTMSAGVQEHPEGDAPGALLAGPPDAGRPDSRATIFLEQPVRA